MLRGLWWPRGSRDTRHISPNGPRARYGCKHGGDPPASATGLSQVRPGRTRQHIFWNRFLMSAMVQSPGARPDFLQKKLIA
jgi:hypothetical protein